nr:DNA-directed DNA polymerase [Tanacetum cinerariifolium]
MRFESLSSWDLDKLTWEGRTQINVLRGDFNKQEENLRRNLNNDTRSILGSFFQNQASTSGILLSNTIPNPKGEIKAVTTRSGLAYEGPSIPTKSSPEKVVERETEATTNKEQLNCQGSTAHIQPLVVPNPIPEPDVPKTQPKPNIPYPSRLNDQKLHEKTTNQMEKFFQIFHDFHFDISFVDALLLMPKFASTIKSLLKNKDKLFELAKVPLNDNCSTMILKKLPENLGDPGKFLILCDFPGMDVCHALADLGASINFMPLTIWKKLSLPELTPTRMTLELADRSITRLKGVPLILGRSFLRTGPALIDVYGEEITLRVNDESVTSNLNQTMRYSSTYVDNSVNRIDVIEITCEEYAQDMLDFKNNSKSGYPTLILMEEDYKPAVQSQRRVNPEIYEVIKKEVIELLDARMIYPISDSLWVSPVHCVPKKGGMTVVANENNELTLTRLVTGWRVCIDYKKLNDATRKDHFPLLFIDQMLERLAGNEFYLFLDGFLGYFQIPIDPQDQEKTTFKCPYGTFAYRRMPFGLCNAPGHKISKSEIKVDRAKVDVIAKLPHPPTVKGVRSFLGHADCINAFETLKKKLTEAPILIVPDWNLPFELMRDASDFAIGAVLGQRKTKHFQPIHYASKTITKAQIHYTTAEKEMLAVVYAFKKFRPYLVLSKSIVYTDHSALKYLLSKQDAKPRLLWWVLLLQEFDITIRDKKGSENLAADHLSRLENPHKDVFENKDINENFPLETLGKDVPMENFKIYSNPLFDDEEINSNKIDPHYFNAESNLIESLSNRNTLFDSSPKFDYLEDLMEKLLTINSFPRLLENSHANMIIKTLPTSPIPVEDSDSLREEINIFTGMDDFMPPGIGSDDYDSDGDIHFLKELLSNDSISFPENKSSNFDHHDDLPFPRPPSKPPDVEIFFKLDSGVLTTNMVKGISKHYVLMPNILPTLPTFDPLYPVYDTLLLFSSENKDKVFKPGILSYLLVSHRDKTTFDFSKNPMMMYGGDIHLLDVPDLHTIPMD